MTAPRTPEQRARFVRTTAADLDVAPELAERLLRLSEAAREHTRSGAVSDDIVRALLDDLQDDEVCRHAWQVAVTEGEPLWRLLRESGRPPRDVGPAVLLAMALARRGAADAALDTLVEVVRPGEFRPVALELLAELAEDAGQPALAWAQVMRLGLAEPDEDWSALRCVLGCSARRRCERSRLAGVMHARWLRGRLSRWYRRPWSGGHPQRDERASSRNGVEPWRSAIAAYIDHRRSVLPFGERQLLEQWAQAQRERVTVLETAPWEGVVLDAQGYCRTVGWEVAGTTGLPVGTELSCWLLPTLVPSEQLLARWMVPTSW